MHVMGTNLNLLIPGVELELAREWQDISDKCNFDDPYVYDMRYELRDKELERYVVVEAELFTGRIDPRFCRIYAGRIGALRIFLAFTDYFLVPQILLNSNWLIFYDILFI